MNIEISLLTIVLAGLMNGSFATPMRFIKHHNIDNVWLLHGFLGLIVIPYIFLYILVPDYFIIYEDFSSKTISLILIGGAIFGIGQICFFNAISKIGIALSFTLNLSIGMIVGSLFVLFYQHNFISYQGFLVTVAIFFILISLITNYISNKNTHGNTNKRQHHLGWILASIAGISSGFQNITFIATAFGNINKNYNSFAIWPPFLFIAAIPIIINFAYKLNKNKMQRIKSQSRFIKTSLIAMAIGVLFTGSLALYSTGMNFLPKSKHALGWPLFMIFIILASQIWGVIFNEDGPIKKTWLIPKSLSILFITIAITLLTKGQ